MNRLMSLAAVLMLAANALAQPAHAQPVPQRAEIRIQNQDALAARLRLPVATPSAPTWSDVTTTGAAGGYCLAKHPYRTSLTGTFTPDGYEIVSPPGIVGAVRRNFIHARSGATDQGQGNSCPRACAEFGKLYGPSYKGVALRQQVAGGAVINSGIGDLGALAMPDHDYYLNKDVIAGVWSRGNTWHESDVAQADYCCCQAK